MTQFLAELYLPRDDVDGLRRAAAQASAAAEALSADGTHVRHVHSIYVPEDETCFLLFDAPSAAAARAAAGRAALPCNRVVEFRDADPEEDVQ